MSRARSRGYPFLSLTLGLVVAALVATALLMRPAWSGSERTPDSAGFDPARLTAVLVDRHEAAGVRSLSVAARAGADGRVHLAQAGADTPNAGTVYEVASLSKPVTAWAVLDLARQGRLDLDAPRHAGGEEFTLRDVLHHAAGFDNALGLAVEPVGPPGEFAYAGQGFMYLATVIEETTGQDFATYMNSVVLPRLGMTDSAFGADPDADLALPAIDGGIVLAFSLLGAAIVFLLPGLVLGALSAGLRLRRGLVMSFLLALLASLAAGGGVFAALALPGMQNLVQVGPFAVLFLGLIAIAFALWASGGRGARGLALLPLALLVAVGVMRPPVSLAERPAIFLAPAGLRASAADYLAFLDTVMVSEDPVMARMRTDLLPVQEDTAWGLGIAVEDGDAPSLWHWGINYPGYQAFAIAWPETGDIAVVLMAGGEMSVSPDGMRYSGLELALEALAEAGAPLEGRYWQGIQ